MWVFYVGFIHDNFLTAVEDVRVHLLNDEAEGASVPLENLKEQLELVQVFLLEHVDATGILAADRLCHFGDKFGLDDSEHLGLGLGLQPVVRILLLIGEHLLDFVEVLRAIAI